MVHTPTCSGPKRSRFVLGLFLVCRGCVEGTQRHIKHLAFRDSYNYTVVVVCHENLRQTWRGSAGSVKMMQTIYSMVSDI